MKKWTYILCIAILATSCDSLISSKPSGTLSEEQMADVLVDIHLTEATLRIANDSITRLNDTNELRNRFATVFKKNDVTPDEFNSSLNYYLEHIEKLDKIYVEVINRLTALEATLQPKTNSFNKLRQSQSGSANTNPWFRSLNKTDEPEEIQYFDSVKYPVSNEKEFILRTPLIKKPE